MNVASCGQGMGKVSPLHSSYEKGDAMTEEFYESHASCVHGYEGRACATADEGYWGDDEEEVAFVRRWNSDPKTLGAYGEDLACELLKRNDYIILERNWACPAGEADIIALDDGCLVFVEVKTRAGGDKGFPQEAVTPKKRARYERIAYSFLSTYDGSDARVRFDVIAIQAMPNSKGFVKHIVNAFGAGA